MVGKETHQSVQINSHSTIQVVPRQIFSASAPRQALDLIMRIRSIAFVHPMIRTMQAIRYPESSAMFLYKIPSRPTLTS